MSIKTMLIICKDFLTNSYFFTFAGLDKLNKIIKLYLIMIKSDKEKLSTYK